MMMINDGCQILTLWSEFDLNSIVVVVVDVAIEVDDDVRIQNGRGWGQILHPKQNFKSQIGPRLDFCNKKRTKKAQNCKIGNFLFSPSSLYNQPTPAHSETITLIFWKI